VDPTSLEFGLAYVPVLMHRRSSSRICGCEALDNVMQCHIREIGQYKVGLAHTLYGAETHGVHPSDLGSLHASHGVFGADRLAKEV